MLVESLQLLLLTFFAQRKSLHKEPKLRFSSGSIQLKPAGPSVPIMRYSRVGHCQNYCFYPKVAAQNPEVTFVCIGVYFSDFSALVFQAAVAATVVLGPNCSVQYFQLTRKSSYLEVSELRRFAFWEKIQDCWNAFIFFSATIISFLEGWSYISAYSTSVEWLFYKSRRSIEWMPRMFFRQTFDVLIFHFLALRALKQKKCCSLIFLIEFF